MPSQAPDTTTLEYAYRGVVLMPNPAGNVTVQTADTSFGDTSYQGVPTPPIYEPVTNITDSGTVTATVVLSGAEALRDAPSGPGAAISDGTLGNNATHEAFQSDIVYVEKYTLATAAIISQYQWQGKGDNSHADEHWKFLIYLDDGSGTNPGHLLFVSDEQTISSVGSTTTTQSYSPSALSVPAGVIWVGIHLNENHVAPTYTHGGNALDAPDAYSDGPNDPFSGGGNTNDNLRDRLLTYIPVAANTALVVLTGSSQLTDGASSGNVTATAAVTGSEQLTDQTGNVTVVAVLTGAGDMITESGTVTALAVLTGEGDFISESGTVTAVVVISGQDGNDDAGTVTATVDLSGDDSQNQEGTVTAVVDLSGLEYGQDAGEVDALVVLTGEGDELLESGTVTAVAVIDGTGFKNADEGTVTAVAVLTGSEAIKDAGSLTATAVISLAMNGLADHGLVIALAGPFTQFAAVAQIPLFGTVVSVVVLTNTAQRLVDAGTLIAVADPEAAFVGRDFSGSLTATVDVSGLDSVGDRGTVTATVVLSMVLEALAELGNTVIATVVDGIELFTDEGLVIATVVGSAFLEGIGDADTLVAVADIENVLESIAWTDAGECDTLAVLSVENEALAEDALVTAVADLTSDEELADEGSDTFVSVVSGTDGIGEVATVTSTASFSAIEMEVATGECDATAIVTGFHFPYSPTGSRKGFAFASMQLKYPSSASARLIADVAGNVTGPAAAGRVTGPSVTGEVVGPQVETNQF